MATKVIQLEVGPMANFSYIIADDDNKVAAVVDPSWDLDKLYTILETNRWLCKYILNTHTHFDHVLGNEQIQSRTGAQVIQYQQPGERGKYFYVSGGEQLRLGNIVITILHTPGHSKESICLLVNDEYVFTGDTLFVEACGRIDLAGGDVNEMYDSLYHKVSQLDDNLIVYPGHNYGSSPWSTIAQEKKKNPALHSRSRHEFVTYMT